jgi:uncharacterized OB-fold protein
MSIVDVNPAERGPIAEFWAFLRDNKFMIQRSVSTGKTVFYPRLFIPGSGESDLEWVEASGRAVVYAASVVLRPDDKGGDYSVVLVDLDEGPRMLARVEGVDPHSVEIGMSVVGRVERLREDPEDAQPVVVFYPEAS